MEAGERRSKEGYEKWLVRLRQVCEERRQDGDAGGEREEQHRGFLRVAESAALQR